MKTLLWSCACCGGEGKQRLIQIQMGAIIMWSVCTVSLIWSGVMQSIVSSACITLIIITSCFTGYWAATDGKFQTTKQLVPDCLDSCDLITTCRFFHKTWRYMDAYRYVSHLFRTEHVSLIKEQEGIDQSASTVCSPEV